MTSRLLMKTVFNMAASLNKKQLNPECCGSAYSKRGFIMGIGAPSEPTCVDTPSANLLTNGDFEAGYDNWDAVFEPGSTVIDISSGELVYFNAGGYGASGFNQLIDVDSSIKHTFSCTVRIENAANIDDNPSFVDIYDHANAKYVGFMIDATGISGVDFDDTFTHTIMPEDWIEASSPVRTFFGIASTKGFMVYSDADVVASIYADNFELLRIDCI